jgi:cysteine desulfurase/selenocysteine lyase
LHSGGPSLPGGFSGSGVPTHLAEAARPGQAPSDFSHPPTGLPHVPVIGSHAHGSPGKVSPLPSFSQAFTTPAHDGRAPFSPSPQVVQLPATAAAARGNLPFAGGAPPGVPTVPQMHGVPSATIPTAPGAGASHENPGDPRRFATSVPDGPNHEAKGGGYSSTGTNAGVPAGADPYAGLSQFVRNLRVTHTGPDLNSGARLDPHTDVIRQIFAGAGPGAGAGAGGPRPFDIDAIRADFPVLHQLIHGKPLAWLDNAATTQKPQSVIDAISRFYAHDNSNIHRAAHTLAARSTDAYEQARQKVQSFVGAGSAKEILFVRGTTEGINLVAQTFGRKFLRPGDEIVLSTLEHHANIVPWQLIAKETGAIIRVIPVNDRGEILMEQYQAILGPKTRFVSLTQASNSLGTILPVGEMTQLAKRYNARVLIDGAQSVAHIPVNVRELDADFFVFSGHKIFGPTGIGAVYAKEELQEIMPPWQGGGNMIKNVTFEETSYSDPPAKFEAGTPNIADAVGLGAALDYVNRLGLPNIARHEHELLEYGTECLSRIDGLRLIGTARDKVGVLSFVLRDRPTEEVGKLLDLEGIAVRAGHHCSQPSLRRMGVEKTVRPSISLYNTKEEIERLAAAVKRIARQ